jgi:uncharacterized protein (TIGR02145 family)
MKKFIFLMLVMLGFFSSCKKSGDKNWSAEDEAYYTHVVTLQKQAIENYSTWSETMDSMAVINQLEQFFAGDTSVSSVITGSQGIAVQYTNGMRGGIFLDPKDNSGDTTQLLDIKDQREYFPSNLKSTVNLKKKIFLNPSYWQRSFWIDQIIGYDHTCLPKIGFDQPVFYKNAEANLDKFSHLSGHGIIYIYSHGWAWPKESNITDIYLMTGEEASVSSAMNHWDEIKSGIITISITKTSGGMKDIYWISKDFITSHNDFSKDTILFYGGFCYSYLGSWPEIRNSFARGAYFGSSWSVTSHYCTDWAINLLWMMTDTSKTPPVTTQNWMDDPSHPKSYWDNELAVTVKVQYAGDPSLTLWVKTAVTTNAATNIDSTSATCGGTATGGSDDDISARGVCWSKYSGPTLADDLTDDGYGLGSFTSELTDLTPSTPYYVRAYVITKTNKRIYGNEISFTTAASGGGSGQPCPGMPTITDPRDGQVYPTVQIGSQCWLQANLNYQTGNSWCYEDNGENCTTYGRLYDWSTAMGACPSGWRLPNDNEWAFLTSTLGGESEAGLKMKSASGWANSGNGTNISGFTALPGGCRNAAGTFFNLGSAAFIWTSTELDANTAYFRFLEWDYNGEYRYSDNKAVGLSVRCLLN